MSNPIPRKLRDAVNERDGGLCQYCGGAGSHLHHIVFGGTGRKRIHRIENLVTLCIACHGQAHTTRKMRLFCYQWSRERYGDIVDKLLRQKWSGDK